MPEISHTAAFIAVKLYGLTKDPNLRSLFPDQVIQFYEKMVGYLPRHLSWYQDSLRSTILRRFFIWTEEIMLPGDLMHIISRKYYITKETERAVTEGYEQIVSLGAGFDHLGVYFSDKGIPVFELDIATMIREKELFLQSHYPGQELLTLLPADVNTQRIKDILTSTPGFDPAKKTLFIAEGFFDYLSFKPSEAILEDIRSLNKRNKLLTTFFSLNELNLFHRFVFTSGVSLVGESLKFKLEKQEFVEFLEEMNFTLESEVNRSQIEQELLRPLGIKLPVLKGFYILGFNQTN